MVLVDVMGKYNKQKHKCISYTFKILKIEIMNIFFNQEKKLLS